MSFTSTAPPCAAAPRADTTARLSKSSIPAKASANARLLVVGTRGIGGFKGLLMGSVSNQVVEHAPCDVLVVRKLGLPSQPELAMGAIASGGALVRNEIPKWSEVVRKSGIEIE